MVDFAIRLVNSFLNLPDSEVFGGNSNYRRTVINPPRQKGFWATLYIVLKGNLLFWATACYSVTTVCPMASCKTDPGVFKHFKSANLVPLQK